MDKKIKDLPNFRPNKAPVKKTVKEVVYHVVGIVLSIAFVLPILYMLATSTKSELAYAESIGTLNMFLPDFANSAIAFENYKSVLVNYVIGLLGKGTVKQYYVAFPVQLVKGDVFITIIKVLGS